MLHVHADYSDRFVDLAGGGFDAAVRLGHLPDSSLLARRICAFRGSCVASPAYLAAHGAPATPEDLLGHEALMQGTEPWRFTQQGSTRIVHPRGRFKADNGISLLAAAIAGLGIAALPDFLVAPLLASGALQQVLVKFPPPEAGLYVVRPPAAFQSRKVRALTDILLERFRDGTAL
jgi:DNA-binding transcriptional LysR family regulator